MFNKKWRKRVYNKRSKEKRERAHIYWDKFEEDYILDKFGGRCAWCGSQWYVELDHFIPIYEGGKTIPGNLYPACRACNRGKGGKGRRLPQMWAIGKFGWEHGNTRYKYIRSILAEHHREYLDRKERENGK